MWSQRACSSPTWELKVEEFKGSLCYRRLAQKRGEEEPSGDALLVECFQGFQVLTA